MISLLILAMGIVLLICGSIFIFQLILLSDIGLIYKRLGPKTEILRDVHQSLKELIGTKTTLVKSRSVFASLACSSCYGSLKRLSLLGLEDFIVVYLIDQNDNREVQTVKSLFPEFKFNAQPGKRLASHLKITQIPLYVETDFDGRISEIYDIKNDDFLVNILKEKGLI